MICEWVKAKKIVGTVDGLTTGSTALWSITLTVPPSSASLKKQTKGLLGDFRALRRLAPWKNRILGGVRCLHAPYRPIDECWHPHIHVIAEGWAIEPDAVAHKWLTLTGGFSRIKQIDDEDHRRHMAWYVAQSPNKDFNGQPELLAEFIKARRRMRLKQTFGHFWGTPLMGRGGRSQEH